MFEFAGMQLVEKTEIDSYFEIAGQQAHSNRQFPV
jgi:hypothetical protein